MTGDIMATGSEVANDTMLEARFKEEELVLEVVAIVFYKEILI